MSFRKVKDYLEKYNLDEKIIELKTSTATVSEAAVSLNCEEGRIAKSLTLKLKDRAILIVCSGNVKIDNSKFKQEFDERPHMLCFDEVEKIIGHPVGSVCPFAVNEGIDIYLDISLKKYETVFPACGCPNTAIEISIKELDEIIDYKKWIDVCK